MGLLRMRLAFLRALPASNAPPAAENLALRHPFVMMDFGGEQDLCGNRGEGGMGRRGRPIDPGLRGGR